MNTVKFKVGQHYQSRSICDSNCIATLTVVKRTDKTLTSADGKRYGIKIDDKGVEYVKRGNYSMAGIFTAERGVIDAARIPAKDRAAVGGAPVLIPAAVDAGQPSDEVCTILARDWSSVVGEPVTVVHTPSGAWETRGASEVVARKLAEHYEGERACVSNTATLGWRFILWPEL